MEANYKYMLNQYFKHGYTANHATKIAGIPGVVWMRDGKTCVKASLNRNANSGDNPKDVESYHLWHVGVHDYPKRIESIEVWMSEGWDIALTGKHVIVDDDPEFTGTYYGDGYSSGKSAFDAALTRAYAMDGWDVSNLPPQTGWQEIANMCEPSKTYTCRIRLTGSRSYHG